MLRLLAFGFASAALLTLTLPTTPVFAQASGHVRVKILKAGLLVGGGAGTGVLTYRGRSYPFSVSGLSFGITAGATVGRLEGWASGIRDISDFAGTYSSVGGGGALVGGVGGVGQPDHITRPRGIQSGALLTEHRLCVLGDERLTGGGVGEDFAAFERARAHPRVGDAIAVGGVHTRLHLENEGAER